MVSEVLAAGLAAWPDLWVLGRFAADDPCLVEVASRWGPDVLALGVGRPRSGAAALIEKLRPVAPSTQFVVVAETDDGGEAVDVARAGAAAWIGPGTSLDQFVAILRGVTAGQAVYSPEMLGLVLRELRQDIRRAHDGDGALDVLSPREREVLLGMVEGRSGAEMALDMFLSANTIRTHTRAILTKLKVHSRLEAVAIARAAGIQPITTRTPGAPGSPVADLV